MFRIPLVVMLTLLAASVTATHASGHVPYRYAPDAITWTYPPAGARALPRGHVLTLPRATSDIDVWTTYHGRPYRLRQRRTRDGYCFTRARARRCVAGYVRVNRDMFALTRNVRVYYWKG